MEIGEQLFMTMMIVEQLMTMVIGETEELVTMESRFYLYQVSNSPCLSYLKHLSVSCKKKGARSKMRGG